MNILNTKITCVILSAFLAGCSVTEHQTFEGKKIVHERSKPINFDNSKPTIKVDKGYLLIKPALFSEHEVTRTDTVVTTVLEKNPTVLMHTWVTGVSVVFLGIFQMKMLADPTFTVYKCSESQVNCKTNTFSDKKVINFPVEQRIENDNFYGTFQVITDDVRFYTELGKDGLLKVKQEALAGATDFTLTIATKEREYSVDYNLELLDINYSPAKIKTSQVNKSHKWYVNAAKDGNVFALYKLGLQYEKGIGTKRNMNKAIHFYSEAATKGVREAQYKLGWIYLNKAKTNKKDREAVNWIQESAEQGDANAQNLLGELLYSGKKIEQNKDKALQLYLKSAKQGNKNAQFNLSVFYYDLSGTDDLLRAYQWGVIANKNGRKNKTEIKLIQDEMNKSEIKQGKQYIQTCMKTNYKKCI